MSKQNDKQIKVGVGIYVVKDGKYLLLHKRKGSHGEDSYATAGGHMEHLESFSDAALRESAEECGPQFKISKPVFLCLLNLTAYAPKHYVHISMVSKWVSGEPQLMEPDKAEGWAWYPLNDLPAPLFYSTVESLEALKTGKYFFE